MIERPYTLSEVERMRAAVKTILYPTGFSYNLAGYFDHREQAAYNATIATTLRQYELGIEDQLRTYMMACIDPCELEERAKVALDEAAAKQKAYAAQIEEYERVRIEREEREEKERAETLPPPMAARERSFFSRLLK